MGVSIWEGDKAERVASALEAIAQGGGGGTDDYEELDNKPSINNVTLVGNKTLSDLGAASASDLSAKYTKPQDGIPASDLASGVIPTVHNVPAGGSAGQVLTKTSGTDYEAEWATPQVATDAQVAEAVDDWLGDNVAQETGYVLDRTLLLSNAAAPADMVGELKNEIDNLATDGEEIYHVANDGTKSKKIKFVEGCIQEGFVIKEPAIDVYDKGMSGANVGNKAGLCITVLYDVDPTHEYTVYRANANSFSFSGWYESQKYKDNVYVRSAAFPTTANTPQKLTFTSDDKSVASGINQIRFTLITAEIKDSYMYDNITGEIIFAGSATQYYGKKFIDGHLTDTKVLTNKNLEEVELGLMVGKDGAVHLSVGEFTTGGNGIKFSSSAIEYAKYETEPKIEKYGFTQADNHVEYANAKTCFTQKYKLEQPNNAIMFYLADSATSPVSWSGAKDVWWYDENGTYITHGSLGNVNVEQRVQKTSAGASSCYFSLPLVTDYIDDSYVYDELSGYVYFAGKNTAYYGLENIYDSASSTGFASVIRSIDENINYLRNDNHDMIPLFITTDQHSASIEKVINAFLKNASISKVSKILNLGDTVSDKWIIADEDHPFMYTPQLDSYARQVKNIPEDKRIDVYGNHDTWYEDSDLNASTYKAPQNHLYKYFYNKKARYFNNYGDFTVCDDYYNIKYLVVTGYEYTGTASQYTTYEISSNTIDWIIREMEKNDGYDIIILSHQPLGSNGSTYHNPIANTDFAAQSIAYYDYSSLWVARKNKTSGSITDAYGVSHSYDFTSCKTDLICGLHGHEHKDGIAYVGNVLCDMIFQEFGKHNNEMVCYYLLIDRENNQANIWRIDTVTNTYTNYQIPFEPTGD